MYTLEGNVTNNFKKLPIKSIRIPICNKPLAVQSNPNFLIFLKNHTNIPTNINNKTKFIIIKLRLQPLNDNNPLIQDEEIFYIYKNL